MSVEFYRQLLSDLGKIISIPDLAPDNDNYCCLGFDDKIIVHFQYNQNDGKLLIFSPIGTINEAQVTYAYSMLLQANLFWQGTAGSVLGVNPETREVILAQQIEMQHTDSGKFQKTLEVFVSTAENWIDSVEDINKGMALNNTMQQDASINELMEKDGQLRGESSGNHDVNGDVPPGGIKI